MLATYTSLNPASTNGANASTCSATSGPKAPFSANFSRVTSSAACSKCCGLGSTWLSSPGTPALGHSAYAASMASSREGPHATLKPAWVGASAPFASRKVATESASGLVVMKPSAMRPATSSALGPKALM